jgi:hypothetical protein
MEEPILYLDFDENAMDEGMEVLSFVDRPATEIKWAMFQEVEQSYNDYPVRAQENACRALTYKEKNPDIDCGTRVGWARANQLCNRRSISIETIARMASFARHLQHKDIPYDKGCGGLMVDAWGGEEGIRWAIRKMEQINNQLRLSTLSNLNFQEYNEEKRMVTAPVMLAETKIPRFSPQLGKYYVKFTKETIEKMMKKYFKENKIHKVNVNHDSKQQKEKIYMMESYIVGDRTTSNVFPDLPEGSWVATFYVDNDEVWKEIKEGTYNGFSLEGYFIEKYEDEMIEKVEEQLKSILNSKDADETKEQKIKNLLNIA